MCTSHGIFLQNMRVRENKIQLISFFLYDVKCILLNTAVVGKFIITLLYMYEVYTSNQKFKTNKELFGKI